MYFRDRTLVAADAVPGNGLIVYRASRLEALIDPLRTLLEAAPPSGLLDPAELITAHPGMRRWLLNRLADAAGPRGIAANIEVDLPGQWIDKLSRELLPASTDAAPRYTTEALRWSLFELFQPVIDGAIDAPQLGAYLAEDPGSARRWQLASSLGELFGRLLVYRPDWLQAWSRGQPLIDDAGELPALWRALRQRIGSAHRAELHQQLLAAATQAEAGRAPLHVFGISHLPPRHLEVLRSVSRQRLVVMYCPDPCIEHWAGLGSERQRLRDLLDAAPGAESALLHLETPHPLLASLGKLGQQFGALLAAADEDIAIDVRHSIDAEPPTSARHSLLGRLQESIRRLDPELLALPADPAALRGAADASLRIHRCHGRWRELEVLRDALLQALAEIPDLRPSEIAVLTPSMADYAPLLGAVFGAAGDPASPLPYHVADLPVARSHPLHAAWLGLIGQAQLRSSAPQLMALLRLPAVRRALELDAEDVDTLQHGLGESAAAFGLDPAARGEESLPALAEHTLEWGLDRLCLGYAIGDEEGAPQLFDGLLPAGIGGEADAYALGALHRLLSAIKRLRREAHEPRPASRWISLFRSLWQSLFHIDPQVRDEVDAEDALLDCLAASQRALRDAGCDPPMHFAQAQAMLQDLLSGLDGRAAYLHGGITFCGMVPQRSLPYRMICVLGLDEPSFPRRPAALQLDPLPRHPRIGDREVSADDRYLFLETLMAARERLHLSWVGEDARQGSECNPSPVLAELLDLLDAHAGQDSQAPLYLLAHPLQPFDLRYSRKPADQQPLRSYGPLWRSALPPAPDDQPAAAEPATSVRVEALRQWLRNPAQELLRQRWRMPLRGLAADTLPADEPLDTRIEARETLWRQLLDSALASREPPPASPSPLLLASGLLPPGRAGRMAYARERLIAVALYQAAIELPAFAADSESQVVPLQPVAGGMAISGLIAGLRTTPGTLWLIDFVANPKHFGELGRQLDLLLRAALLGLSLPADGRLHVLRLAPDKQDDWAARLSLNGAAAHAGRGLLEQIVAVMLSHWQAAEAQPLSWFPKSSAALLEDRDVAEAWYGDSHTRGERDWEPGYAWLLAGERQFWLPSDAAEPAFAATAASLSSLLGMPWPRNDASPRV